MLHGGPFKPAVVRLARVANVPVIPCVILGTGAYRRFKSWMPLRRTVYALNYGEPITPRQDLDEAQAVAEAEKQLRDAFGALYIDEDRRAGGLLRRTGE